ncbi:MAG: ComEC/Rec2 family competence protein [Kiritimatiellales bacterium]
MQPVRRPLMGIALSIAAGLWLEQVFQIHPLLLLAAGFFLLMGCFWETDATSSSRLRSAPSVFIYLTFSILAAAVIGIRTEFKPAALLHAETAASRQHIRGIIMDDPADMDGQTVFRLRVSAVNFTGEWLKENSAVQIYLSRPAQAPAYGEEWEFAGSYTAYPKTFSGLSGYFSASDAMCLAAAKNRFLARCYSARRAAAKIIAAEMEGAQENLRLLEALLLGLRRSLPDSLYRAFSYTGMFHIFAISGLHVGVMAAILAGALKTAGISRRWWGVFLIPALFIYVASTGMKASALRAFTMASIYFLALLFGRRPDVPSALAAAAIILLVIGPEQISDPGFLLSFIVVCGLVMVHSFVMRRIRPHWTAAFKTSGARMFKAAGLLLLTSIAAWIFSMPLSARYFNTVSPAAIAGNLGVIPLTFVIVLTGCFSLLTGIIFPPAALMFNHANRIFTSVLIAGTQWLAAVPGERFFVQTPPALSVILWYAGFSSLFTGPVRLRKISIALIGCSVLLWPAINYAPAKQIELHRPVDSAIAIRTPDRGWILATAGSRFQTARTVRFLQQHGVNHLDELIITHRNAAPEAAEQLQEIFRPRSVTRGTGIKLVRE